MQREFVAAPEFWSAGQAVDQIRMQAEKSEDTLPELFLIFTLWTWRIARLVMCRFPS